MAAPRVGPELPPALDKYAAGSLAKEIRARCNDDSRVDAVGPAAPPSNTSATDLQPLLDRIDELGTAVGSLKKELEATNAMAEESIAISKKFVTLIPGIMS
jgi:hypothetical protein